MTIINKELKYAEFSYDEESKTFTITEEDGNRVILNKVYAFAFMRFVVRMAQRNWLRKPQKTKNNLNVSADDMSESDVKDHPNQLEIFDI